MRDKWKVTIGGTDYSTDAEVENVQVSPDSLCGTASLVVQTDQYLEGSGKIHVGEEIILTAVREDDSTTYEQLRGIIVDKPVPEENIGKYVQLSCADHLYRLDRQRCLLNATSQTLSKTLYLFFKDDGSGSGDPEQYCVRAELHEGDPDGVHYIPREDMDKSPLVFLRRRKTGESDYWFTMSEYEVGYARKELVFRSAQVDDGEAMPKYFADAGPATPGPGEWTYIARAIFFQNPIYPSRNTSENTVENILRTIFAGDPDSSAGGGGFTTAQLNLTLSYTKGSEEYITDRIDEGMRVISVSGADIVVSDGGGFAPSGTITYTDLWGTAQTNTVDSIAGDTLTLHSAPTGLIADMRILGGKHNACAITLTGGDTTAGLANYTDIVIGGATYFIREIRDTTTLMIVNDDEDNDFSGLAASGSLTYPTLEYTGLQVQRLTWDKEEGTIASLLQWMYDNNLLPRNYHVWLDAENNVVRGRQVRQTRGVVSSVAAGATGYTDIRLDDVDGFYPGETITWKNSSGTYEFFDIEEITYASECITVVGDATAMVANDYVYAYAIDISNRKISIDHVTTMETQYRRVEVISTADQVFPLLTSANLSYNNFDIDPPTSASEWGNHSDAAHPEYGMCDNTPDTGYVIYRERTGAGLVDTDPEDWGFTVPWTVAEWDLGADTDVDQILLRVGYCEDYIDAELFSSYIQHELPMFTATVRSASAPADSYAPCSKQLAGRQFDPQKPNSGEALFDCDLIKRFRYIRLVCDRPFFYKQGEGSGNTPTRRRDIPVLDFQAYRKPDIRYTANDENSSATAGSPTGQITPYIDQRPFASLTDQGGIIGTVTAGANTVTLAASATHSGAQLAAKYTAGDTVSFWDTSDGLPFTATCTVDSVSGADVVMTTALPAGLADGDELGGLRRWMLDLNGVWRDLFAINALERMMEYVSPEDIIEEEMALDGWDAQQIAVSRLYEHQLNAEDGEVVCSPWEPGVKLHMQVVASSLREPEIVMGITFNGFDQTLQTRQYNVTAEEVASAT